MRAGRRTSRGSTAASSSKATSPTPTRSASAIEGCDALVNFAAESHVDRSIESPGEFIQTDVFGTYVLLEAAREAGIRHLQISTDEVYGSIEEGSFTESSPLDPSSPYSASKAGGDLLVGAYQHTYGTESLIVRASNNYGPRQHPEKLIPLCILNALAGDPLPVYGDGQQVRNWLWVEDFATAIDTVLEQGNPGEVYNVGGPDEAANIDVVREILKRTDRDESLISTSRTAPATTAATRSARRRRGPSAGRRRSASKRGSRGSSTGTAQTRSGGSRSAPASTASTTSASTAPSFRERQPRSRRRSRTSSCWRRRRTATSAASCSSRFARTLWAEHGVERAVRPGESLALVQGHPARPPLPDQPRPGEARALRSRRDLGRRGRPAPRLADLQALGGRTSSRTRTTASSSSRSASATGSASCQTSPTSPTSSRAPTTPTEAGSVGRPGRRRRVADPTRSSRARQDCADAREWRCPW